jgi:hypothetical protein
MPVTNWNSTYIDGKQYLVIDVAKFRIPLDWDPSSNMFFAVAAPDGGLGNFPALVKGDQGDSVDLDTSVVYTALAWNDPTPEFASLTELSPGLFQLHLGVRNGAPGANGTSTLNPATYGTPVFKKILRVNAAANGFEYQTQKVGDRFYPAILTSAPSGNPSWTMGVVGLGPFDFDWRPECFGDAVIVGTGPDVGVNIVARLNGETGGNIVARGRGLPGINPAPHTMIPFIPAGSLDTYDKVLAGATATVHFRVERITGNDTYTASNTDMSFWVKVNPIP